MTTCPRILTSHPDAYEQSRTDTGAHAAGGEPQHPMGAILSTRIQNSSKKVHSKRGSMEGGGSLEGWEECFSGKESEEYPAKATRIC